MAHGKWWAITSILFFASLAHSQIPTPIRSVSSLPATCKGGNATQSSDMVVLIGSGVGVTYMCTAPNTWSPIVGGGGSISGSPAINTQVAGNGSAFFAQTKPVYDTRDWMTCDGNGSTGTDASNGMNNLLSTIGTTEATILVRGSATSTATCRIGNTFFGPNITLDFSAGGAIQLISSSTVIGGGTYVNGTSVECGAGVTCSLPALSISAGNTIVVAEAPYPGFTFRTTKVTDSCGNFYIHVFQSLANQPRNQGAWIASSVNGGSCTITATANGSLTTHMMLAAQVAGMGPVTSLDASASNNSTGLTMSSGSAATLTGAFLFAFGGQPFTAETCTAGAGYTQPATVAGQSTPNGSICAEYNNASAGGSTSATQTITADPSPGTWVYSLISLKPGNATATIWGGIVDPDQHQIFYNADSATGHGVVDFTGSGIVQDVYPEWWGASTNATAAVNTPAIQAAFYGAWGGGLTTRRTNGSLLSVYNRPLRIGGLYQINDELKMYSTNGFQMLGVNRLSSGFVQTGTNKRIIDGQSNSYGLFANLTFTNSASNTGCQVDLDWNGVTTPGDLRPQFIDFNHVNFVGNAITGCGVIIAKSGGGAQGSNIYCRDCESISFTTAAWQIGTAAAFANNALAIGYSGDIQGCNAYGILSYGGGYISFGDGVEESSMENGFTTQTGFDMACVGSQGPCSMDYMRSESRRLISGNDIVLHKSRTINQSSYLVPGGTFPVNSLMSGSPVGGDGAFYKVTSNAGAASGIGTLASPLRASGGTGTTLADTNQTVAGSVTIKAFVASETVTQAVTGSTGTILTVPTSSATISGTLTSGSFAFGHTAQQAVTAVTCTIGASNTSILFNCSNFSGTADGTNVWTDLTTLGTFTPSGAPVFSVSNPPMLITAATGAPDNSHTWTGGTSVAVYTPTGAPTNQANFTVNAFVGQFVSTLTGKNAGCYGVITSNTATDVTFTAGWTTRYAKLQCPFPDTTSTFVVEPGWNHGTVTSGGMTMQYLDENAIDCQNPLGTPNCAANGRMEDVNISGGKVKITPAFVIDNLLVARQDWLETAGTGSSDPQQCCEMINNWDGIRVSPTVSPTDVGHQGTYYQSWTLPSITGVSYSGATQQRLGTKALVWDAGNIGNSNTPANTSGNSVWIGGRSDAGAGTTATRNILEFGGMLGRGAPLPSVANAFNTTDQAGQDTDFIGGPSTGTASGGAINFWTSNPSGSSSTPNSGLKRWLVSAAGHWLTGLDNTYDIGATGATRPRSVYVGTQLFLQVATGTAPLVVSSTTTVPNLTASNHPKVQACGTTSTCSATAMTSGQIVQGSAALVSGTPSAVTITAISPAFTSTATYNCTATEITNPANNLLSVTKVSGSSITITGPNTLTDVVAFICAGN